MMKKWLLLLLFGILFSGQLLWADDSWRQGPDSRWFIKLEPALEKAKKENKFVYVLNTGSDWCGFCKRLARDVLIRQHFDDLIQKYLVPVYLDQPSRKVDMPQAQRDYNRRTTRNLSFGGGVPSAVLLDADGNKVGFIPGYRKEALYITGIYKQLNLPGCPEFPAEIESSLISRSNPEDKNCKAVIKLEAWGYSPNQVNKPVSAGEIISIPPDKELFFKIVYTLPENFEATLDLFDHQENKFNSIDGKITGSGSYILKASTPVSSDTWGIKAVITPHNSKYRKTKCSIPASFRLDPKLLDEAARAAFEQKYEKMRKDFAASKFEIVSWGTGRTFDTPYSPEQGIQVPPKTLVNIKIRYTIPEPAAIIGIAADRRAAGRIFKCNSSGERVCRIYVRNDSSSLNISIHPQKGGLLKNIISIPCNIRIKK